MTASIWHAHAFMFEPHQDEHGKKFETLFKFMTVSHDEVTARRMMADQVMTGHHIMMEEYAITSRPESDVFRVILNQCRPFGYGSWIDFFNRVTLVQTPLDKVVCVSEFQVISEPSEEHVEEEELPVELTYAEKQKIRKREHRRRKRMKRKKEE